MCKRLNISIAFLLTVFIVNQIIEHYTDVRIPFLFSYLDDLLVVPITLGLYRSIRGFKNSFYGLPFSIVLVCIIGFALHFELLMPILSAKYTRDAWDVLMYTFGGVGYLLFMNGVSWKNIINRKGQSAIFTRG